MRATLRSDNGLGKSWRVLEDRQILTLAGLAGLDTSRRFDDIPAVHARETSAGHASFMMTNTLPMYSLIFSVASVHIGEL